MSSRIAKSVRRSLVVSGQGYFPVALRLADGRIAAVLRGGAPHVGREGRLDIVFSSDEGQTWTKPTLVADSPDDDRNPAFGQAADGTLVVGFWRCARYDGQGNWAWSSSDAPIDTWVTRSTDGGRTWSPRSPIDVADFGWGSPYGKILTLPDGSMLMPVYGGPPLKPGQRMSNDIQHVNYSYLYRSTDHGRTWTRFSTPGAERFNETGLARLPDGTILAAMRTTTPQDVWLTKSHDGGATWEPPRQVTPAQVHPPDLTVLPDGRVLMVTGDRRDPFGVTALVGDAAGNFDWDRHVTLVDDATNRDCGYPSSVVLNDGRALTLYYAVGVKQHPEWGVHCAAVAFRP